jgi:alkylation response protein AidB-like acyl-CoA dehydrogenase
MDFALSEEQELLQDTLRDFVQKECPPARVRELFDGAGHDPELWNGLVELGVGGLALPERYGGAGLEILDLALASEVLGEGCVPGPFLGHALAGLAILWGGSEAQRERWLPRLATGNALGSVALGESAGLALSASLADVIAIGAPGGGLALVERGDTALVIEPLDGVDRSRRLGRVRAERARREPLTAAGAAERARDAGLVLLAADAFGAAWRLLRMTIEYTGQRQQFGTRLAQFQAVKHQLADAATALEPTRALWWYAAHAQDRLPDEAAGSAALA